MRHVSPLSPPPPRYMSVRFRSGRSPDFFFFLGNHTIWAKSRNFLNFTLVKRQNPKDLGCFLHCVRPFICPSGSGLGVFSDRTYLSVLSMGKIFTTRRKYNDCTDCRSRVPPFWVLDDPIPPKHIQIVFDLQAPRRTYGSVPSQNPIVWDENQWDLIWPRVMHTPSLGVCVAPGVVQTRPGKLCGIT